MSHQEGCTTKMITWLAVTLLLLNTANSILHGTGIYLLNKLFEQSRYKIQQNYLIHLSACEFTFNTLEVIKIINSFIGWTGRTEKIIHEVFHYVLIIQFTGVSIVFYLDMLYLTLDRLFEIWLNIKYPVHWNLKKAKWLMRITWLVAAIITVAVCLARAMINWDWEPYIYTYFFPTMEFIFVGVAIITYTFLFKKFKRTRISPINNAMVINKLSPRSVKRRKTSFYVFRRSKFFIPFLLILTFLIFMVGADLTLLFVGLTNGGNYSFELKTVVFISYAISNLFDAWIYIFLQKDVKRLLYKKLKFLSSQPSNAFVDGRETSVQLAHVASRYSANYNNNGNHRVRCQ